MRKDYQNKKIDTSQPAVPEMLSVALAELAGGGPRGFVGSGGRYRVAVDGRDDGSRRERGLWAQGRRVPVTRPRMRALDGSGELAVPAYGLLSGTEILGRMAMERMLAGLSTRRNRGECASPARSATPRSPPGPPRQ